MLPGHLDLAVALDSQQQGAPAIELVDGVDGTGQARFALDSSCVFEQGTGVAFLLDEPGDQDAGLLVAIAAPEEFAASLDDGQDDRAVVGRRIRQGHIDRGPGLGRILLEAVCHREDGGRHPGIWPGVRQGRDR